MSSLSELQAAVEAIRSERFADLPAEIVNRILEIEEEHIEDRGPAPRSIETIIDAWLETDADAAD